MPRSDMIFISIILLLLTATIFTLANYGDKLKSNAELKCHYPDKVLIESRSGGYYCVIGEKI